MFQLPSCKNNVNVCLITFLLCLVLHDCSKHLDKKLFMRLFGWWITVFGYSINGHHYVLYKIQQQILKFDNSIWLGVSTLQQQLGPDHYSTSKCSRQTVDLTDNLTIHINIVISSPSLSSMPCRSCCRNSALWVSQLMLTYLLELPSFLVDAIKLLSFLVDETIKPGVAFSETASSPLVAGLQQSLAPSSIFFSVAESNFMAW